MKKFTDIKQFRDVIREIKFNHDYKGNDENGDAIYLHDSPYPTLNFRGTIKLHGTNSAIIKYKNNENYIFQSRERELELTKDNASFMLNMMNKNLDKLFENIQCNDYVAIYGEWIGQGIQKTVAISELEKSFVVFAIKIDDVYQDLKNYIHIKNESERIYNILDFKTFNIDIDFNIPELSINTLRDWTIEVETECPVAKHFGISGIGEGIVFESFYDNKRYIFKSKGEKHQNSKVKTLNTVDTELINNINEFVEYACTENRLKQGIDKMIELNIPITHESTGKYLQWGCW